MDKMRGLDSHQAARLLVSKLQTFITNFKSDSINRSRTLKHRDFSCWLDWVGGALYVVVLFLGVGMLGDNCKLGRV